MLFKTNISKCKTNIINVYGWFIVCDAIEQYLKEHLPNIKLDVVDLSDSLLNDPFQDTMTVVNSVFTSGEIDKIAMDIPYKYFPFIVLSDDLMKRLD